jgi:hypothetical protein
LEICSVITYHSPYLNYFPHQSLNRIRAALAEKQYGILRILLVVIFGGTEVRVAGPTDIERPPVAGAPSPACSALSSPWSWLISPWCKCMAATRFNQYRTNSVQFSFFSFFLIVSGSLETNTHRLIPRMWIQRHECKEAVLLPTGTQLRQVEKK